MTGAEGTQIGTFPATNSEHVLKKYVTWELTDTDTIMTVFDASELPSTCDAYHGCTGAADQARSVTQVFTGLVLDPADVYLWIGTKNMGVTRIDSICAASSTDPAKIQQKIEELTFKFPPVGVGYGLGSSQTPECVIGESSVPQAMVFGSHGWQFSKY